MYSAYSTSHVRTYICSLTVWGSIGVTGDPIGVDTHSNAWTGVDSKP